MSIQLTDNAAAHVRQMLEDHPQAEGLRLGTRKSGCSGYAYVVDYADAVGEDDAVFESLGVRIVVDKDSLSHLDGTTVDFVRSNALNSGFEFINPNARNACGCGESVTF